MSSSLYQNTFVRANVQLTSIPPSDSSQCITNASTEYSLL